MKLKLDNRTQERVQVRIQQGRNLFGATYLEPKSRASSTISEEYSVRLKYAHDGWEHDSVLTPNLEGAQYVVSVRADRAGWPVSVDEAPARTIKSIGCENTTIAPVVFSVERTHPHLTATMAVKQWQNQQIDISDTYEIRAVVAGRMTPPLTLNNLDTGIDIVLDEQSELFVLRQ